MSATRIVPTAVIAAMLVLPAFANAQEQARGASRLELRLPSGGFIATGAQRSSLEDAGASAAQVAWLVRPRIALTGTFTWARSRDLGLDGAPKLDVFTSDLGVEARTSERSTLSGFIGGGAGARSYNHRSLAIDATNNLAAYASVGGTLTVGRIEVRLEARDYATGFRPLVGGGKSEARNDVMIMGALRLARRNGGE